MAVDVVKVVKWVGVGLSIAATIANGWSGQKTLEKLVAEQVEKATKH